MEFFQVLKLQQILYMAIASLNTSAVVEIGGNYYVWSSVSTTKEGVVKSDDPPSFAKPFTLSAAGCSEPALKNLPSLLKSK